MGEISMIKGEIKVVLDKSKILDDVRKAMKQLKKTEVVVGIPQEANGAHGPVTNAQLALIHDNGSPINKIPARPILLPAIEKAKAEISEKLKAAHQAAAEGKSDAINPSLEKAGMFAADRVKERFEENDWAPNSPGTIKRKGSDKPLVDTAELKKSMTYVVREKGS